MKTRLSIDRWMERLEWLLIGFCAGLVVTMLVFVGCYLLVGP